MKKNKKTAMPFDVEPMLATLTSKPSEEGSWVYEVKWDGFRAIAYKNEKVVELKSRNLKSFNEKFYPLHKAISKLSVNAVIDGEIVVLDKKGMPDFAALQAWRSEADGTLVFIVFDILWLNGQNLMNLPLTDRRKILKDTIPGKGSIRFSDSFDVAGADFFSLVNKMGLEGIVAKKPDSLYKPGLRTKDWLKIKTQRHQEVVIGGYTINENTSRQFSSLLTGIIENGDFVYTGSVGTGFYKKTQKDILERLRPLVISKSPFNVEPEYNKPSRFRPNPPKAEVVWVKPEVVAEITYKTVTTDGKFRHPSFKGLREDKSADQVVREVPVQLAEETGGNAHDMEAQIIPGIEEKGRSTFLNPSEESQTREINGKTIKFSSLSKVYWPEDGITKRDLLNYYYRIAPFILPYIKDRPQTMYRFPSGIHKKGFYQKDVKGKVPDWLPTYNYYSEKDEREKEFPVCSDEAGLLYLVSLGCISMNPWSSRMDDPDHPDWCILDLDPDKNPFEQVIEAAQVIRQVLDAINVPSYCKTSGSTGLHIYIPLERKYTYEDSKEFGRAIVKVVQQQLPDFTSIERLTSKRKGKVYLDFLQNRPQATVASPYSVRARPGAPVSMPLPWDEVKNGLQIRDFTIYNAFERAKEQGDIFTGVLGKGIDMEGALERLKELI
jgi:bifunctional non-homologous end joining protein LigD